MSPALALAAFVLHVGLDLRTDLGTHGLRASAGLRAGRWDFALVLDPLWLVDRQHDLDLTAEWSPAPGWGLFAGWRATAVGVAGGTQWQQLPLLGITADLPSPAPWLRLRAGGELAVLLVKHGAGLPADWIGGDRGLVDHLSFGLFVRVEYATAR